MNIKKKAQYLFDRHFGDWSAAKQECERELSDKQAVFCICGRLATGLHEAGCSRFRHRVESMVVKKLGHLIPKQPLAR